MAFFFKRNLVAVRDYTEMEICAMIIGLNLLRPLSFDSSISEGESFTCSVLLLHYLCALIWMHGIYLLGKYLFFEGVENFFLSEL